jgi:dipeptidyl aminopeptidase/acylaminoacyl peptidase
MPSIACSPWTLRLASILLVAGVPGAGSSGEDVVPPPAAMTARGVPAVPAALLARVMPDLDYQSSRFLGWHPVRKSILVGGRSDQSRQLFELAAPGADGQQLTFGDEPILGGEFNPGSGDITIAIADEGGDENYQLYRVEAGRLTALTSGGRNLGALWTSDGREIGYSTTRRTGLDTDLHMMDPRKPESDRLVMEGRGGGWSFADFSQDGRRALLFNFFSVAQSGLHEFDLANGTVRSLLPLQPGLVSFGRARYGPDNTIYAITDQRSEHHYLARIDRALGDAKRLNPERDWSVEDFDVTADGRSIAYVVNEDGTSRLRLLDVASGGVREVNGIPDGIISGLDMSPWGELGFSLSGADHPGDVFSVNIATLAVTRWTRGSGPIGDGARNSRAERVHVRASDGLPVSGLLYRPDSRRFPGPRPVIVSFHGGPEGQSRPGYLGRMNYWINELGIALLLPNVRGSLGYGRTFAALDNGPDRRADVLKDVRALIGWLENDAGIDSKRMGVTGGSYGGYMALQALARFPGRFRAGVSVVGISNLVSFLENTEGYRRDLRRIEYGDERDPATRRKLADISPLSRAGRIRAPLLVVAGRNDPRVPASEADAIAAALRGQGRPVWQLTAADEGHGFAKKPNADFQFLVTTMFWQQHLLGGDGTGGQRAY